MDGSKVGQMVHYVAYNKRCLAAIIIGGQDDTLDLAVFTNLENVNGVKNFGVQFQQDISYSEEVKPGTWRWPNRE